MFSIRFNRSAIAAFAFVALAVPGSLWAQTPDHPADNSAQFPSNHDLKSLTATGSYLAARHASVERDSNSAAAFYRSALRTDPKNNELLDRAFISSLADGDIDEAVKLAERILTIDKSNRVARLVIGVRDLKAKKYASAQSNISQSVRGPITDLVATLLSGWASYGAGDTKTAVANIDKLTGPEWYPIFKDMHSGMILELAGKEKDAGVRLERSYKLDDSMLRVADDYARWLSRNKDAAAANAIYAAFDKKLPRHPLVLEGLRETKAGKKLPPLVDSPQTGAAEALYGIGATLTRRGGEDLALVYLQLALYLAPNHPLALLSLADLYESVKKPAMAIKVYERMPPNSPLKRNAQIQLATNLDAADRSDEAIKILKGVIAEDPKDLEAIMALGNIERGRKKFADCTQTYSQGINALPDPNDKNNTVYYYYRGICEERTKQWSKAEADMRKALELQPDQPHVLNYLGYSWIDQGINLDEGMKMIKRAVDQRPDDGYIVDSLGWAYFRIGNYEDAVKNLERAIDLKPEDPTINDHLGDAYWRVGRTLEAKFQWVHARDLKPEPEDLPKIEAKIENGLPDDTSSSAASADKVTDKKKKRQGRLIAKGWSPMAALIEDGRAKVNLTLRVLGRRVDGYHDIESMVAFADCADRLTLTPGPELGLETTGPLAQECGEAADNLVLKAARLLGERVPDLKAGSFTLDKVLPVAAGIGGGSADAAAALRLLARLNGLAPDDARLIEVALQTGADVPVCLASQACDMTGVGETLLSLSLPKMPCVLVNPRVPVATRDVFEKLGLRSGELLVGATDVMQATAWPEEGASLEEWVEVLAAGANDLEAPATRIQPVIGEVIAALNATNGAWLARMSGSGATCFAIYENTAEAQRASQKIQLDHPLWWVHAGVLS